MHTAAIALVFFVPVALAGAIACIALRPDLERPWQLRAARAAALGTTLLCFAAATAHFLLETS